MTNPLGPVRSAYISACPVGATGDAVPCDGYTGADGGFCFRGLAQGRYKLTVFVDGGFEPAATTEVATGRTDVSITIPGAGFISGIVVRGTTPIEGAALAAVSATRDWVLQTGRGGRFRFSALPAGSYDIETWDGLRITGVRTGTDELVIRLPPD